MRMAAWLVGLVAVMACGGSRQAAAPAGGGAAGGGAGGSGPASVDGGLPVAGHNEVCYARDRSSDSGHEVATCAEGLECCYPCGIPGCDSVCHTPEECQVDMTRP